MKHFFYQIKAKKSDNATSDYYGSPWAWPPVFSGMVETVDRDAAKDVISADYVRKFPTRVLKKDLASHDFILHIRPVVFSDQRTIGLFEVRPCRRVECGKGFRVIDKYNDDHERDKGFDFCCYECRHAFNVAENEEIALSIYATRQPVIYRITNVLTEKSYIGKTTQAFTLRWYQHFFHSKNTKFHTAIKESKLSDWVFSVLEIIEFPADCTPAQKASFVEEREAAWIKQFNAIKDGYNTTPPIRPPEDTGMDDIFEDAA